MSGLEKNELETSEKEVCRGSPENDRTDCKKVKRILITGAGSYIGTSFEKYVTKDKFADMYSVDTLDMQNTNWREHDFSGYDSVFHVAGIAHADVGIVADEVKKKYYAVNTDLAVETAKKAKRSGVGQFILMSSMIVYGTDKGTEPHVITKDTEPNPANFYGDSKWQADKKVRQLESEDFKVVVLRPPMIYGKGSKGNYPALAKLAVKLPVFPKMNNRRSMLYIGNLCEFVRLMIENKESGVFFPQNEEAVSTDRLVKLIANTHGHKIWITPVLNPFVKLGMHVPGKFGGLCRKAFGSSYYEAAMSEYRQEYRVCGVEESVLETEGI